MDSQRFNKVIEKRIEQCKAVLCNKQEEYASDCDRLHNFKVAATIEHCSPISALAGMMVKHTVSVYDLISEYEQGKAISRDMWDEKIGDSINYLLLLTALIDENQASEDSSEDDVVVPNLEDYLNGKHKNNSK